MGLAGNKALPLLDSPPTLRSQGEVVERALTLYCVVAIANGGPAGPAVDWLRAERLTSVLSHDEALWLEKRNESDRDRHLSEEEALWALVWALGFISELKSLEYCEPSLAGLFPRVTRKETSKAFRDRARLRQPQQIFAAADLLYCMHSAIRDAELNRRPTPLPIETYVIEQRRRALEWILSDFDWDDVPLDT